MPTSKPSISAPSKTETIKVRPITFAEIESLTPRDAEPVNVYVAEESRRHGLTFTPATLSAVAKTGKVFFGADIPHDPVYAAIPNDRPNARNRWVEDKDTVVGHVLSCDIRTMFGMQTNGWLFTTPEAEATAADVRGFSDPSRTRTKVYVEDSKAGREERLTPVFGSQVTTGFIVEGIDADEALARAEAALRAEFGDAVRPRGKFQSRPVADKRVNIFTPGNPREVLALNVLDAEVSYYMRSGAVDVEEVDPAAPQIAVG
jgi:hypothetical protein